MDASATLKRSGFTSWRPDCRYAIEPRHHFGDPKDPACAQDRSCLVDCGNGYFVRVFAYIHSRDNIWRFSYAPMIKTEHGHLASAHGIKLVGCVTSNEALKQIVRYAAMPKTPHADTALRGENHMTALPAERFPQAIRDLLQETMPAIVPPILVPV